MLSIETFKSNPLDLNLGSGSGAHPTQYPASPASQDETVKQAVSLPGSIGYFDTPSLKFYSSSAITSLSFLAVFLGKIFFQVAFIILS